MKKRIYSAIGIVLMVAILFVNCYFTNNNGINIIDTEVPLAGAEDAFGMLKFENWQQGDYNYQTGKYSSSATRLCLIKCPTVEPGQKYTVNVNQSNVHILIREMSSADKVVASRDLINGKIFEIGTNTSYMKIAMYVTGTTEKMTYDKYKNMFDNGLQAYLTTDSVISADEEAEDVVKDDSVQKDETDNTVNNDTSNNNDISNDNVSDDNKIENDESFGMADFSNWKSGNYSVSGGKYTSNASRICLNDYVTVSAGQSYVASITDSKYHILIRALDENNKLVTSYNLANGDKFTTTTTVTKLGISIYDTKSKITSFDMYKALFENGFKATLKLEDGAMDDVKSDIIDNSQSTVDKINNSQTVVDNRTPEQKLRAEILEMLENGEMGTRDISSYKFNFSKVYLLYEDVIKNEGYVPYACTYGVTLGTTTENGIIKTIKMNYMDSGFVSRYEKLKTSISEAKSRIKDEMLDVEKALVFHDYVVKKTTYSQSVEGYAYASGALANEYSNCSGYTLALMLLLHEEGIECYYISGNNGTHGWVYAILDGEGYFIDATWDDTSTRVSGQPDHYFFVRNDNEFKNDSWRKHYQWKSYEVNATSTSTKYTNWFVHDVVSDMYYVDGFWYYWDRNTNTINRARIDGSEMEQLVQGGSSKLKLSGESAGTITYTLDGIEKNYTIK